MSDEHCRFPAPALLRLQSWLSPAFPTGAYSYSHGLEWAVEAGYISDRKSLVDWLDADLCYGSGRNEAIFFSEAYRCAGVVRHDDPNAYGLSSSLTGTGRAMLAVTLVNGPPF